MRRCILDADSASIAAMLARRASFAISAALMVVALTDPLGEAAAQQSGVKACTTLAEDGQRLRAAGKLIDARDRLMACSATECPQVVRADCAQWASEVLASTPTIVIDAKDTSGNDVADAKVFIDDKRVADRIDGRPIPVDPGSHRIRLERADGSTGSQSIVAKENAKSREVKIVLGAPSEPERSPSLVEPQAKTGGWGPLHYVGLGLMIVGAIGITYGFTTYVSYRSEETDLRNKFNDSEAAARGCASDSPPTTTCGKNIATREQLRTEYNANEADIDYRKGVMFAATIGGFVFLAGGIVMFVLAPSATSSAPVKAAPVITPHFAGMTLGGTF